MTDEDPNLRKRAAIAEIMPKTPFIGGLGLVFDKYEPDDVVMRLPFREDLTNDGVVYHGGVVAAAIDTTAAACAWSNHDFVGAARQSDLICTARTVRRARELVFLEITATDTDGRVCASAVQTYRISS
jgi:acyl-coenzyme A thioesterase PaaI-like protein